MDFKDLSYIVAIATHQNITKAANSLYVSQPTLTKFLQNTEKNLGQRLFNRLGNKFVLTYAGERYVEKAKEILNLKKELDFEMADIMKSNVGSLNVAFPAVRGTYMLPCTLPVFKERFPNVKTHMVESSSSQIDEMILSGTVDIGFFNAPTKENSEMVYEVIAEEELLLVMSKKHPLAKKAEKRKGTRHLWIDLSLLQGETLILQSKQQRTRQTVDALLAQYNILPDEPLVTSNIIASAKLAAQNYGIAFICDTHLKHLDEDIGHYSIGSPKTTVKFVAAYRKGSYLSYHAQEYIEIVKDFT